MSASPAPRRKFPEAAIDALAGGLLAVFAAVLFLAYLDPGFPYSTVAAIPLVGSLCLLFWMNRRSDRIARDHRSPSTS